MKALVCKSCGSSDLVKKGDYYECQYCRTKYIKENEIFIKQESDNENNTVIVNTNSKHNVDTKLNQSVSVPGLGWIILVVCVIIGMIVFAPSHPKKEDTPVADKFTRMQKDKERLKQEVSYSSTTGRFAGLNDIEMLMAEGHPKVLDSTDSGYKFFRDMGNKKFYFKNSYDIDFFGTSSRDNILEFQGSIKNIRYIDSKEKTTYITCAYLWFSHADVKVDYNTAIRVIDTYIPKDVLRKYYKLSYSNKYTRPKIGPNYELLYVLADDKTAKSEGLPSCFRIVLSSGAGDSMMYATINTTVYPNEEKHIQSMASKGYSITKWDYDPLR